MAGRMIIFLTVRKKKRLFFFFNKSESQTNDPNSETVKISLYMFLVKLWSGFRDLTIIIEQCKIHTKHHAYGKYFQILLAFLS